MKSLSEMFPGIETLSLESRGLLYCQFEHMYSVLIAEPGLTMRYEMKSAMQNSLCRIEAVQLQRVMENHGGPFFLNRGDNCVEALARSLTSNQQRKACRYALKYYGQYMLMDNDNPTFLASLNNYMGNIFVKLRDKLFGVL